MWLVCTVSVVLLALVTACGGGPESEYSYSDCYEFESDCFGDRCRVVEACESGKCESELSYYFASEEYESKCTFEYTQTTTEYPLSGGFGTAVIEQDIEQCYYEIDIDYYDDDVEEEGQCSVTRDCTVQNLECAPSEPGAPDCEVISASDCRR